MEVLPLVTVTSPWKPPGSRPTRPHPLFRDFVEAARVHRRAQAGRSLSATG
jgi:hypothetical protein